MKPIVYLKKLFDVTLHMVLQPKKNWEKMQNEQDFQSGSFRRFFLPWLALYFVAVIIGNFLFESEYGFLFSDALIKASRKVLVFVLALWSSNILIYEISRKYKVPVSFEISRKISTYALLPLLLVLMLTALFPFADIIGLLGFYSLYMVYSALQYLYQVNFYRNSAYLIILLLFLFLGYAFIALILSKLTALIIY